MDESPMDERFSEFEKRQQLFISQRLEYHSNSTNEKIQDLDSKIDQRFETLDSKVDATKAASETAHKEIIARLERIESRFE